MTKKKEDLGGVWRTVGGRRIFIKDGQDLYEAMNDSGKFTNLKKTNSQRKKEYRVDGKTISEQDLRREFDKELERGNVEKGTTYHDWKKGIVDDRNSNVSAVKEIDYIGQDGKLHKMNSYEYPKDRDAYHKYLTEKYGTYKEEEIKDKNGRTDYKKLREEFYESQKENTFLDKRNKEIEFERKKGIYTGARETNPDGSYKHQKEFENKKIDDFVKNNPDWEIGRYDEEEYDDLADTLGVGRNNVAEEIYDRIREKNISDRKEMFERVKKDFIEKTDKREAEVKKDMLLEKASKIEEIEAELKEVQSRVWNAEIDMADQGIEENRWRENPSYNEDRYRLVYLRRDLEEAKDDYWKEKNKINQKRWEKELNSKSNTTQGRIVKDDRYYDWVDEVDPNSELTESELEQMYRSIYPNRRKK